MFRVFIGSLVTAIVLFAVGGISVLLLGRNERQHTSLVTEVDWVSEDNELINETFTGDRTWSFTDVTDIYRIEIVTSGAKTYLAPSDNGELCIKGQSSGWNELAIEAEYTEDGGLYVTVGRDGFGNFILTGGNSGSVTILVPDEVYALLSVDLKTGSFSARGIGSLDNRFDVGSGSFELEQKEGFEADRLVLDLGSGTAKIANAAAAYYDIDMGSGNFDVSGLTGYGEIYIGSGSGTAHFARIDKYQTLLDLGSGHLTVYIPEDTRGDLYTDIGSGSVTVNCCGISQKLTDDSHITFNGGSNNDVVFRADLGSGKIELRNSSEYTPPDMFEDLRTDEVSEASTPVADATMSSSSVTGDTSGFEPSIFGMTDDVG